MGKIKLNGIILVALIFMPITTLLQGFSLFGNINRILIGLIIVLLFLSFVVNAKKLYLWLIIFLTIFLYIFAIIDTKGELYNSNDLFYFILWVLFFLFLLSNMKNFFNFFETHSKLCYGAVVLWNILTFISLFFRRSYIIKWGEGTYFISFTNGAHRFASSCLLVISIVFAIYKVRKEKKVLIYSMLPCIGILLCGARTYLATLLIYVFCFLFSIMKNKRKFFAIIIPVSIVMAIAVFLSPMGTKIIYQLDFNNNYFDAAGTFTNGRTVFWNADLKAYSQLPFINLLVGNGFNFVYEINYLAIDSYIWAHNDIINILLNFGLIGAVIYLYLFIKLVNIFKTKRKLVFIELCGVYLVWIVNAMLNMVYVYVCALIAIPFILYSLSNSINDESDNYHYEKDELVR